MILAFVLAGIVLALLLEWRVLVAVQDQIDKLNADIAALVTEVGNAVQDIANLKAQLGNVLTPEQSAALDTISTNLEKATADLKAGE